MKLARRCLVFGFCFIRSVWADLTIAQKVEGVGGPSGPGSEVTVRIKGDKARIDALRSMLRLALQPSDLGRPDATRDMSKRRIQLLRETLLCERTQTVPDSKPTAFSAAIQFLHRKFLTSCCAMLPHALTVQIWRTRERFRRRI